MALEATHIRFALDLKDKYQVQNIKKYISGTIYPDSRFITGIDRNLTHNNEILKPKFVTDDFKKGWQVHQICDIAQHFILRKQILFLNKHPMKDWKENKWVEFTSAKIIQDMADMQKFDIQKIIGFLEYAENPNGEDIKKVKEYNKIMINLYKDKTKTTVEDNYKMWLALGIGNKLCNKVKEKTSKFLKDKKLVQKIESCYQIMLNDYQKYL